MARPPAATQQQRDEALPALREVLERARATPGDSLFCACCGHPVTALGQRIDVDGAHQHRVTNPHGLVFDLACFREAWGGTARGEATSYYSWFPGYSWQLLHCADCGEHLGWHFQQPGDYFYGLIIHKLNMHASR